MNDKTKSNGTYQLITPANTLKERVGGGFGIDAELAKRADSAVENLHDEFLQRITGALGEIAGQVILSEAPDNDDSVHLAEIRRISIDMQAQGAAFGYPLISDICVSLCSYLEIRNASDDWAGKVIRAHTDAIRSVVGNAIDGDGGRLGRDLVASLNQLVAKSTP